MYGHVYMCVCLTFPPKLRMQTCVRITVHRLVFSCVYLAHLQIHELETLAREQQSQLRESAAALLDLQTRLTQSEAALSVAEEAATASVQELRALQDQVWGRSTAKAFQVEPCVCAGG